MRAGVDQEGLIRNIQRVRIIVQCLGNTIHRRLRSVQPVRIEYGVTIEQGRHFQVPDFRSVEARNLIMVLGRGSQSCIWSGDKAGQRCQKRGGEAPRISFEHFSS